MENERWKSGNIKQQQQQIKGSHFRQVRQSLSPPLRIKTEIGIKGLQIEKKIAFGTIWQIIILFIENIAKPCASA